MDKIKTLKYFARTIHPKAIKEIIDVHGVDTFDELIQEFHKYLLNLGDDIYEKCDINLLNVISNMDSPFRQKGWSSVLILHFDQFMKQISE